MNQTTYKVIGMTCDHCAKAVESELSGIDGVHAVVVSLNPDGASSVLVSSATPLDDSQVVTALAEAGEYVLA